MHHQSAPSMRKKKCSCVNRALEILAAYSYGAIAHAALRALASTTENAILGSNIATCIGHMAAVSFDSHLTYVYATCFFVFIYIYIFCV